MICLVENNPTKLVLFEGELTISKAMNGNTLNKLSTQIEKKNVIKAIAYLTLRLSENFNVGKKFTASQASIMALDLFEVFGYETLEDVMLMFKYARQGRIGDGKDFKLDSQTVFHKWIPAYLELKAKEREDQHLKEKYEAKELADKGFNAEIANKMFEGVGDEILDHKKTGGGLGSRHKNQLRKKGVITNRTDYLEQMLSKTKEVTVKQLRTYLLKYDVNSDQYDPQVYEMVEKEIDLRNKKPKL